jgi:Cft2 family RNA processing exonuclease
MSFSAHVDAKGILSFIKHVNPKAVMLVHGEKVPLFPNRSTR